MAKPEANVAAVDMSEETVNHVAEYVFDTKLHEMQQPIQDTLRDKIKEGVEELSDVSKCNEKIVIFAHYLRHLCWCFTK